MTNSVFLQRLEVKHELKRSLTKDLKLLRNSVIGKRLAHWLTHIFLLSGAMFPGDICTYLIFLSSRNCLLRAISQNVSPIVIRKQPHSLSLYFESLNGSFRMF